MLSLTRSALFRIRLRYTLYRYDIRNRLEDKSQFGLKPNLPRRRTSEDDELEDLLDRERYLALNVDILEHELQEGE